VLEPSEWSTDIRTIEEEMTNRKYKSKPSFVYFSIQEAAIICYYVPKQRILAKKYAITKL
jgi:hypothetical protein